MKKKFGGVSRDKNAESDVDSNSCASKVCSGNEGSAVSTTGNSLEAICITLWQSISLPCVHAWDFLSEIEFEIRRFQDSTAVRAVSWLMLADFSHIYSENWELKAEEKDMEKKKRSIGRTSPRWNLWSLHWHNRKDVLIACQELAGPHPWQAQGWKEFKTILW